MLFIKKKDNVCCTTAFKALVRMLASFNNHQLTETGWQAAGDTLCNSIFNDQTPRLNLAESLEPLLGVIQGD